MDDNKVRERLFFYIVFVALIILMLLMIRPFFSVLVVSLIAVIMLRPVYNHIYGLGWIKERKGLAASLTLIVLFVVLIVPVFLVVWVTVGQLAGALEELAATDIDGFLAGVRQSLAALPMFEGSQPMETSANETAQPLLRALAQGVADFAADLVSSLPSLLVQVVIFIVVVATLLQVYDTLVPKLEGISPLGRELSKLYNLKITAMVKSLVLGVFLIAFIQGAAMGFFYWIAGLPYVFLFTVLSMLLALIPMVGISWLVIGIAIVSVLAGNWTQALIVLFGFYGVVNWIDILLRPKLLSPEASLNFSLFIVAVFAGLAWAGFMGLFYGPVLMLLLVTTVQIYAERYAHEDSSLISESVEKLSSKRQKSGPEEETEPDAAADSSVAE